MGLIIDSNIGADMREHVLKCPKPGIRLNYILNSEHCLNISALRK